MTQIWLKMLKMEILLMIHDVNSHYYSIHKHYSTYMCKVKLGIHCSLGLFYWGAWGTENAPFPLLWKLDLKNEILA